MDWSYISGFFDADGSITAVVKSKGRNKSIQMSFHNNEIDTLKEIRAFIFKDLGFIGSISKKKKLKEFHNEAYDLKYNDKSGLEVANKMTLYHPKKLHRVRVYNLIQGKTKRNGKYSKEELEEREELVLKFFDLDSKVIC